MNGYLEPSLDWPARVATTTDKLQASLTPDEALQMIDVELALNESEPATDPNTCPRCAGSGYIAAGPDETTHCDNLDCSYWVERASFNGRKWATDPNFRHMGMDPVAFDTHFHWQWQAQSTDPRV
jgi:hypothetical protein